MQDDFGKTQDLVAGIHTGQTILSSVPSCTVKKRLRSQMGQVEGFWSLEYPISQRSGPFPYRFVVGGFGGVVTGDIDSSVLEYCA